ncbi:MAG: carboxypeptidase-like regulatory domain-containing protein, partial [Flavobacteriaceae bacterium]
LQYCELKDGNETGIQRPLNIIEKNKNVRGRRKQNELAMNVDLHFNTLEKQHLVVLEQEELSAEAFESLELTHTVLPEERMTYDPAFWADEHIIEPNEAIRNYNVTP